MHCMPAPMPPIHCLRTRCHVMSLCKPATCRPRSSAAGLLLNNLSVFHGCDIVFDSMDVPEAALDSCRNVDPGAMVGSSLWTRLLGLRGLQGSMHELDLLPFLAAALHVYSAVCSVLCCCWCPQQTPLLRHGAAPQVNLGSLQQQLAALALNATGGERISPTLDAILELLDEAPADGAAAAADAFVEEVAEAAGAGDAGALPWAAVQAEAAEGGEGPQGEAAMEGVVGEYAYAAAPDLADAPGMAGGLLRGAGRLGLGGAHSFWVFQHHDVLQLLLLPACGVTCVPPTVCRPPDDYDDDGGFGGDDDYYDAESELPAGEEQEGQVAAQGGEDGAVDQVGLNGAVRAADCQVDAGTSWHCWACCAEQVLSAP